jgi:hypothetical protein
MLPEILIIHLASNKSSTSGSNKMDVPWYQKEKWRGLWDDRWKHRWILFNDW